MRRCWGIYATKDVPILMRVHGLDTQRTRFLSTRGNRVGTDWIAKGQFVNTKGGSRDKTGEELVQSNNVSSRLCIL